MELFKLNDKLHHNTEKEAQWQNTKKEQRQDGNYRQDVRNSTVSWVRVQPSAALLPMQTTSAQFCLLDRLQTGSVRGNICNQTQIFLLARLLSVKSHWRQLLTSLCSSLVLIFNVPHSVLFKSNVSHKQQLLPSFFLSVIWLKWFLGRREDVLLDSSSAWTTCWRSIIQSFSVKSFKSLVKENFTTPCSVQRPSTGRLSHSDLPHNHSAAAGNESFYISVLEKHNDNQHLKHIWVLTRIQSAPPLTGTIRQHQRWWLLETEHRLLLLHKTPSTGSLYFLKYLCSFSC